MSENPHDLDQEILSHFERYSRAHTYVAHETAIGAVPPFILC
jgi:hypothetical protein